MIEAEPMTGEELRDARRIIGEAVYGRMLSLGETAQLCGLSAGNGADTIRKWEEGDGPSGPVANLVDLYCMVAEKSRAPFATTLREIIMARLA